MARPGAPTPHNAHTLASTRYFVITSIIVRCIAYTQTGGRKGSRAYCPRIVQWYCTRVGNAGGRGECKLFNASEDGGFEHNSLEVNEYLAKAKTHTTYGNQTWTTHAIQAPDRSPGMALIH